VKLDICQVLTVNFGCCCSPFYRQKSKGSNQPAGDSLPSTEASERSSHASVDELTWTAVDKGHGWSNVNRLLSSTVESVIPAADSCVDGRLSLSSLSQRTSNNTSSTLASSVAANFVLNNSTFVFRPDIYRRLSELCRLLRTLG